MHESPPAHAPRILDPTRMHICDVALAALLHVTYIHVCACVRSPTHILIEARVSITYHSASKLYPLQIC